MCKRIYLDTDLWNTLFYQNANPDELMQRLQEKNAVLVFSSHNLYEIAKSVHQTEDRTRAIGKKLIAFLMAFFNGPILHPIESDELLRVEATVNRFMRAPFSDEIFVRSQDTDLFKTESQALLQDSLRPDIDTFIQNRKKKLEKLRTGQMARFVAKPNLLTRLKAISRENLSEFLNSELQSAQALRILDFHLHHVFPKLPTAKLRESSLILMNSGIAPFTHSLVRATFYMNWRAANNSGLRPDVPDDMYHMLGATYCDIYATGEPKQSYAVDILASKTSFKAYPRGKIGLTDWLVSIA